MAFRLKAQSTDLARTIQLLWNYKTAASFALSTVDEKT